MKLSQLRPGEQGRVSRVTGEGAIKRRLIDMGLTPGVTVSVRRMAPMGDPMEIALRGYALSLRRADAARILMAVCENNTPTGTPGILGTSGRK